MLFDSDFSSLEAGFATAQNATLQDLVKWSLKDENRALQDAIGQVGELFSVWTDVQKEFTERIKEFRSHFERIYEGEKAIDHARGILDTAETKEIKTRKEIKKTSNKTSEANMQEIKERCNLAEKEKDLAYMDLCNRVREHEAVKMIRVKDGLRKFSQAYLELADKARILFQASHSIAMQIPDVEHKDIHEIKYTGASSTMQTVIRAKEQITHYSGRENGGTEGAAAATRGGLHDHPPPYSENPPATNPFYESPSRSRYSNGSAGGFVTPHNASNNSSLLHTSLTSPDQLNVSEEVDINETSRRRSHPSMPSFTARYQSNTSNDNPFVSPPGQPLSRNPRRNSSIEPTYPDLSEQLEEQLTFK